MTADNKTQNHDHEDHDHDGHDHSHPPPRPFTRLFQLLRPDRRDLFAVVVFSAAVAVLSLATPIAIETLVNTVAFGVLMWPVLVISAILLVCLGLAAAIRAMQVYVVECLQRRLFVRVVADYAHRLPRLQLQAFDQRYGPEFANRFFDVLNLQKSVATLLLDGVSILIMSIVGMVVLAFYHPFLLGFNLTLILLVAFLLFVLGWGGIRTSLQESHAKYDVAMWLEEVLRCLRPLKFSGGQQLAREKAEHLAHEYVSARQKHFRVVWRQTLFALGLQVVASTVLLGLGGWLVTNRQLTLGQLVAAELIVSLVVASVAKLGKYAETFYDMMSASEKLGLLTDLPVERSGGETLPDTGRGIAIRVQGIQVSNSTHFPIQRDWMVSPNERVAVTGPPGSGKSTLFESLCGLREIHKGVLELDGVDLRSLDPEKLRQEVALVEYSDIFFGTVLENVRVGRANLSAATVRAALHVVGLHRAIQVLPKGLNTTLIPSGDPLSASQGVRLAIARAIVGRPRLLILDGVLDALDLQECPELLPHLFDRDAPWTLLIASTNSDVIRSCDRVLELAHRDLLTITPLPLAVNGEPSR